MTAAQRILAIRMEEKIKRNKAYANHVGIAAEMKALSQNNSKNNQEQIKILIGRQAANKTNK